MSEVKNYRITVLVEEHKTKEGRTFPTYKAVTKNGALVDLKFRKEVTGIPSEKFIMEVSADKINQARNTQYPTWWVAQVISFEPYTVNLEANRKRVEEVFGDSEDSE